MSRRLILTRHAKSAWDDPDLADFDRPLNARGRRAAPAIGRWLSDRGFVPEAALVSAARRTLETWTLVSADFAQAPQVRVSRALYDAAPETLLDELAQESADSVMLIAHNPAMAALAQWLVDETPARTEFHRFPTCATLVLDFDVADWSGIGERLGRVAAFVVPRDLSDRPVSDRGSG